jgi:hypothetical protein
MTDRVSIDPGVVPVLDKELDRIAIAARFAGGYANGLSSWAAGADPGLAAAAESLRQAGKRLITTTEQLEDMRADAKKKAKELEAIGDTPADDSDGWTFGRRPEDAWEQADGKQDDILTDLVQLPWYGFAGYRDGRLEYGYGPLHYDKDGNKIDMATVNAKLGKVDSKNDRWGFAGDGQVYSMTGQVDSDEWYVPESFDGGALTANADAHAGTDGATVGAGVSIVRAAATYGEATDESQNDTIVRAGGTYGPGFFGRAHWDDADNDGAREYGLGFDSGYVSVDVKKENWFPLWGDPPKDD